ncbi:phage tail protein [Nocardia transvalensis]|uniref:Gp37-like protein n=1 Tax=Nocardia transvalensis TaxID=37333 RepID=UPI00189508AE|nr:phage tail protein [Nocardia transvalensis]MBF6330867.1 phage tail protein [Nocardia transvalensis]
MSTTERLQTIKRRMDLANARMISRDKRIKEQRLQRPLMRMWDGDYNFRGLVTQEMNASFQQLDLETGTGQFELPLDNYLARWLCEHQTDGDPRSGRETANVHLTVDKDGIRLGYRLAQLNIIKDENGKKLVRLNWKHDYEELKHIRAWANPWLPAAVQFPRIFPAWGQARWVGRTLLWCNLFRLETGLWQIPAIPKDPTSLEGWSDQYHLLQSQWTQVVKPDPPGYRDRSMTTFVSARFESIHDLMEPVCKDAELTWTCRRYIQHPILQELGPLDPRYFEVEKQLIERGEIDGVMYDFPPWEGARLRHGCLVWDLEDKSAWNTGTSFFGDIFKGLTRDVVTPFLSKDDPNDPRYNGKFNGKVDTKQDRYASGVDTHLQSIQDPNDIPPEQLEEYYRQGFLGTNPAAPGVVFRESEHTGIQSSTFTWKPPTDGQYVGGGASMEGVNAGIAAAIKGIGALLALIPEVGPAAGDAADVINTLAEPFYRDTILAWAKWRDWQRIEKMGAFHYFEKLADKAKTGNPLTFLYAMRVAQSETRETTSLQLDIRDATPWRIGERGRGHFGLGDRIGVAPLGIKPGRIRVERVSEIVLTWDRETSPTWKITVGERDYEDPMLRAFRNLDNAFNSIFALTAS